MSCQFGFARGTATFATSAGTCSTFDSLLQRRRWLERFGPGPRVPAIGSSFSAAWAGANLCPLTDLKTRNSLVQGLRNPYTIRAAMPTVFRRKPEGGLPPGSDRDAA